MRTPTTLLAIGLGFGVAVQASGASAQPIPISECRRIDAPGSYVLVGDLTAAGDCLVVAADFVTIDLAGFAITGDGTGSGIPGRGAPDTGRLGIAVRNETVASFGAGIDLPNADGAVVEGMRAINSALSGIIVGNDGIVSGNIALHNGVHGIFAGGGSTLSGNAARDNGDTGILTGEGTTVTGNTSLDNDGDGIRARVGSTVAGNTSLNNGGNGIGGFYPLNVIGNTARGDATQFRTLGRLLA